MSDPIRIAVTSLGCPKALVDSEKMLALLAEAGCLVGADAAQADVILINTCAFIAPAREESMDAIRQAVKLKRAGRIRRVVVAGCLPQKQARQLLKEVPEIDAVVGVFDRQEVVAAVLGQEQIVRVSRPKGGFCDDDRGRLRLTPRHTAYVRLAEGCSAGCSYCTIPAIRGPLRSKPEPAVLAEADELIADGAIELNLIAQDTTAYGADLPDGTNLARLIRRLGELAGLRWLRLMYANPATMSDEVIAAMAETPKVVPYLDIPLQHISDKVLLAMRRRYDRRRVKELLGSLRRRVGGIAIRTTFIVGFPGESRQDFAELLEFVQAQRFAAVGVFPYYDEPGTPASRLPNQIPPKTRQRRRDQLMKKQQELAFAANAARVGSRLEVLVDGLDDTGRCIARHAGQAPEVDSLCILTQPRQSGQIISARVVDVTGYDLLVQAEAP